MNQRLADFFNPILALFGRKIIESRIGHWYSEGGVLKRRTYAIGWRLARWGEWEGISEGATELDRFAALHKDEIEKRRTVN